MAVMAKSAHCGLRLDVAALLQWVVFAVFSLAPCWPATTLPTLRTIVAVHRLTRAEAIRRYPVDVYGVITYYDPFLNYPRRPIVMVTDKTSTIYVALDQPTQARLRAGDFVEVSGRSGPGDFAPTISDGHIRVLGYRPLPANPPRESLAHLLSGAQDAPWVELEGIVRTVEHSGSNVTLKLALEDGEIAATTVIEAGADYSSLIDAKVRIRGVAGSLFNHHSQLIGVQLLFPNVSAIELEEPAPLNPFERHTQQINSLMTYDPAKIFVHRTHLQGNVTLYWPGRLLCLQDSSGGLCAETDQALPLATGQAVDVLGFPEIGSVIPTLRDASFRPSTGTQAIIATPVTGEQAISGEQDGRLVSIEGRLITQDRAAPDPTIVVSTGKFNFPVTLPKALGGKRLLELQEGSRCRLSGIVTLQADPRVFTRHDGYPVAKSFRIMLRSTADVVVTELPSWWNAEHSLRVLAAALLATLLTLGWSTVLRKRVKRQAEQLRHQATHDGLTGVWNRTALLELLDGACEAAAKRGSHLGLIMFDADNFKQINDRYGHLVGDAVLQELVSRIGNAIRSDDLLGRYGGEEFLVVLKNCEASGLLARADRIRRSIASEPIRSGETTLMVTVSGGAAVIEPQLQSPREVLAAADQALYQAKRAGRNRAVMADRLLIRDVHPTQLMSS